MESVSTEQASTSEPTVSLKDEEDNDGSVHSRSSQGEDEYFDCLESMSTATSMVADEENQEELDMKQRDEALSVRAVREAIRISSGSMEEDLSDGAVVVAIRQSLPTSPGALRASNGPDGLHIQAVSAHTDPESLQRESPEDDCDNSERPEQAQVPGLHLAQVVDSRVYEATPVPSSNDTSLSWKKRLHTRCRPLLHHQRTFSCNGELHRQKKNIQQSLAEKFGYPMGRLLRFALMDVPVFFFYLLFCSVVGATCCLLFLLSFWEVNFWMPSQPLTCQDWLYKVPCFVIASILYLLLSPLLCLGLISYWAVRYICIGDEDAAVVIEDLPT